MTWLRLDDGFPDHPKIQGLSPEAFRLHVRALCFAARYLTDGAIPIGVVRNWAKTKAISELVSAKIWEKNGPDSFKIHDFLDYNPAKNQAEKRRAQWAEAQRAHRNIAGRDGDGRFTNGNGSQTSTDDTPSSSTDESTVPVPSRPVPNPSPKEQGSRSRTSPALARVKTESESQPGFDEFWAAYPRRDDKTAALRAYTKALTRASAAEILAGARRYRDDVNRQPAFTRYPATWLNAGAWANGPLPSRYEGQAERLGRIAAQMQGLQP